MYCELSQVTWLAEFHLPPHARSLVDFQLKTSLGRVGMIILEGFFFSLIFAFLQNKSGIRRHYGGSTENENRSFSAGSHQERAAEQEWLGTSHFPDASALLASGLPIFMEASQQSCVVNISIPILQVGMRRAREIQVSPRSLQVGGSTWIPSQIWAKACASVPTLCCLQNWHLMLRKNQESCGNHLAWVLRALG